MENKICNKCKQLKPITKFSKQKGSKDRLNCWCKDCHKEYSQKRYQQNSKHINKQAQKYYQQNLEQNKKRNKKYYKEHHQEMSEYYKEHCQEISEYQKEYRKTHHEHRRSYSRKYYCKKRQEDVKFRLNENMRTAIWRSLKGNKAGKHWETLLGCTLNELQICMEKQFTEGMSWDNYGMWHIDHRIPISAFNFSSPEHLDFKRCWALSNLQPMWASENLRKSNKLTESFQPSLQL